MKVLRPKLLMNSLLVLYITESAWIMEWSCWPRLMPRAAAGGRADTQAETRIRGAGRGSRETRHGVTMLRERCSVNQAPSNPCTLSSLCRTLARLLWRQ